MNDILTNKIQSIQRCVRRAREEYTVSPESFKTDFTRQDAAILNVIRACDSAIDLANHLIRLKKIGVPLTSADSFQLLLAERMITPALADQMRKMVGFRNIAVHQYSKVDLEIVESVIKTELDHLIEFGDVVRGLAGDLTS
jgi:uncharacterized protein YutE (UPF0331/DUF86 family)